ncbi:uncharacterized protein [Apostichopus japonicus]|uniref:uncharacterized protein isoform X6 n=1 Tax=Stichopus japonicus TaxID=307972 RepID=UPI003AB156E1
MKDIAYTTHRLKCDDAGTGRRAMSYKQLAMGNIVVDGLSPGITCKRPSAYGVHDLQAILHSKNSITIRSSSNATITPDANCPPENEHVSVSDYSQMLDQDQGSRRVMKLFIHPTTKKNLQSLCWTYLKTYTHVQKILRKMCMKRYKQEKKKSRRTKQLISSRWRKFLRRGRRREKLSIWSSGTGTLPNIING